VNVDGNVKDTSLFNIVIRKGMNGFAYVGALFVIYGALGSWFGFSFIEIEKIMIPTSYYLTLFGVILTCLTVYMYEGNSHPPERFSKYVSAPVVIIACAIAGWVYATKGSLPNLVINGLAMLGLAGAFFRIQTSTSE
jgi:hypothetical protein